MESSEGLAGWLADISKCQSGRSPRGDFHGQFRHRCPRHGQNRITANGDELGLTRPHQFVERTLRIVGLADLVSDWDPRWDAG